MVDRTGGDLPDALFKTVFDALTIPVLVVADDGVIHYAGGACRSILGHEPSAMVGRSVLDFLPPEQVDAAVESIAELAVQAELGIGVPTVFAVVRPDGSLTWHAVRAFPLTGEAQAWGNVYYLLPWDAQLALDAAISALLAGDDLPSVLTHLAASTAASLEARGATIHHGWDGTRFTGTCGYGVPEQASSARGPTPWTDAVQTDVPRYVGTDVLPADARAAAEDAGVAGIWAIPLPASPGVKPAVLCVWRHQSLPPVTAHDFAISRSLRYIQLSLLRTAEHRQLAHLATHDPLTGTANRLLFSRRLEEALASRAPTVVLYCDLDAFKAINDTYGHSVGDDVLQVATQRLRSALREGDELARLGGDEFTVLLSGTLEEGQAVAERMLAVMHQPLEVRGLTLRVTLSIGVAEALAGCTPDTLLHRADAALYEVKHAGGGGFSVAPPRPGC